MGVKIRDSIINAKFKDIENNLLNITSAGSFTAAIPGKVFQLLGY